ncbi:hypothetical protein BFN03_17275 [Rhodococcus sp. WMMA185]|uniref:RICIN domain-containing protein n=1 Tax=Rhodococcus sp. WMMA185 TaxID=679318 RepID=UPI00087812CB|nr:RICIN domain-containing protein [Rhodococcus sp. WMMA185]AOW93810.1 hypothetical protein BFN03_17275 [Rhodococcus sp. WMMA185]
MKLVPVRPPFIVGVAAVVGVALIGNGFNSLAQSPTISTAPQIRLVGIADDLFPGISQAAIDAADEGNRTGDARLAASNQVLNLVGGLVGVPPSEVTEEDAISPVQGGASPVKRAHDVVQARLAIADDPNGNQDDITPMELAIAATFIEELFADIDFNNPDPDEIARDQAILDEFGSGLDLRAAIDDVRRADLMLATMIDFPVYGLDGRVVDIVDGVTTDGTPVQMWDHTGAGNQQWRMAGGRTAIVNPLSNKCLQATPAPTTTPDGLYPNGSEVRIAECWFNTGQIEQTRQVWLVDDAVTNGSPEGGRIVNLAAGKCLDVTDNVSANGIRLQLWDCTDDGPNQKWNFPPLR